MLATAEVNEQPRFVGIPKEKEVRECGQRPCGSARGAVAVGESVQHGNAELIGDASRDFRPVDCDRARSAAWVSKIQPQRCRVAKRRLYLSACRPANTTVSATVRRNSGGSGAGEFADAANYIAHGRRNAIRVTGTTRGTKLPGRGLRLAPRPRPRLPTRANRQTEKCSRHDRGSKFQSSKFRVN